MAVTGINTNGYIMVGIEVNTTLYRVQRNYVFSTVDHADALTGSLTVRLDAGQTARVRIYSSSDGSYSIDGGSYYTYFSGHLVTAY